MPIVAYTVQHYQQLHDFVHNLGENANLHCKEFVNYYYTSNPYCSLYLYLSEDNKLIGTIGVEKMRCEYQGKTLEIGFGSNWFSKKKGVGGILYLSWTRKSPISISYGGTEDAHAIFKNTGWKYYPGMKNYIFTSLPSYLKQENYPRPLARFASRIMGFGTSKSAVNIFEKRVRELCREYGRYITVQTEKSFQKDFLPSSSPFSFRYAPTLEELNWRYNINLEFVHYSLFRIVEFGDTLGYVILNSGPRHLLLSHCDGPDAIGLALGVIGAFSQAAGKDQFKKSFRLISCHPEMQTVFERFGFSEEGERSFALFARKPSQHLPEKPKRWLVNYDWGDNGLRPVFFHS